MAEDKVRAVNGSSECPRVDDREIDTSKQWHAYRWIEQVSECRNVGWIRLSTSSPLGGGRWTADGQDEGSELTWRPFQIGSGRKGIIFE